MKDDIPRLVPIWLWPTVLLVAVLLLGQCGCRTGGRTLNTNSSGISSVVSPSDLVKQPNGTYKIKPSQAKQVELPPTKSRPVPVEPKSAIGKPIRIEPKSAIGKPEPFKPTVSSTHKLPPYKPRVNVKPVNIIEGDGGCVVVTNSNGKSENWCGTEDPKTEVVNVKWSELFLFYLVCAVGLLILWLSCVLYRDWRKVTPPQKQKPTTRARRKKKNEKNSTKN